MRVSKSCQNNMIIVVNCDRPRPLYGPFSPDVTAAIDRFHVSKSKTKEALLVRGGGEGGGGLVIPYP